MAHCEPTFRIWVEVERHDPEADTYENIDREEAGAFGATRDLTHTRPQSWTASTRSASRRRPTSSVPTTTT